MGMGDEVGVDRDEVRKLRMGSFGTSCGRIWWVNGIGPVIFGGSEVSPHIRQTPETTYNCKNLLDATYEVISLNFLT
jgi:hypothetical protein